MENNEIIDNNEINSTTEVETNQVPQEPTWLNEMPEKFRTNAKDYDEMVNNAIKSYKNLEYQQSKTFGKPEKYTINEDLKIDEGLLSIAKEVSKELNLSQDMFHKVASTTQKIWAEREKEYNATIEQKTQDLETKMKDYGSDKLSLQPRETVDNNGFTDNDKNDIIFQYNQLVKRGATVRPTTEQQKIINQYNKIKGW